MPESLITVFHLPILYGNIFQEVKETVFGDTTQMYECRRLKEFQRYEFWVTASTSVGDGEPSKKVSKSPVSRGNYHVSKKIFFFSK